MASACTLRAAIAAANASAGGDLVTFSLSPAGAHTIAVGSELPAVTGSDVVLDATTQPGGGAHGIRIDDADAGGGESGFLFYGQRITLRGFAITRFEQYGIYVAPSSSGNVIAGNWIGTRDGGTDDGTGNDGIHVRGGGSHLLERNVVSGGSNDGIELEDSSDNVVVGNYVGMTADGLARLPNADSGIEINGLSFGNRVGGLTAGERNIVSGNDGIGIQLLGSMRGDGTCEAPQRNTVQGNYAGLNVNGVKAGTYGNHGAGIELGVCAQYNTIGGTAPGARNVASGNRDDGIQLDSAGGPGGTAAVCNNTIQGNYAGTNPTGTASRFNVDDGIDIDRGSCNNLVGGTEAGAANVISGNAGDGVDINSLGANGNVVDGNVIGLAADGATAVPNVQHGVHIRFRAQDNVVERNIISASGQSGVMIETSSAQRNTVRNNKIGTAKDGATLRGNGQYGVWLYDGTRLNRIEGNVIAGNSRDGVAVEQVGGSTTTTKENTIRANRFWANAGLGVDLLPADGVNGNDGGTSSGVGNLGLDFPVIAQATAASVRGSAPAGALVEVFAASPGAGETNGEGTTSLGTVTASGTGAWCLGGLNVAGPVTATATDAAGNTSEFAANVGAAGSTDLCSGQPPPTPFVYDTFMRTITNGWGATDGRAWVIDSARASEYRVDGSVGSITEATTGGRYAYLAVGRRDVSVLVAFRFVTLPTSSWNGFYALARVGGATSWYGLRVRSLAGGGDDMELNKSSAATGLVKVGTTAALPEFVAGRWYWLRLEAKGDGTTTTLRGRIWADGAIEPSGWTVTASDTAAELQGTGGVGVRVYATSTAQPARVEVDTFSASDS